MSRPRATGECKVSGCTDPVYAHNRCSACYQHHRRYGVDRLRHLVERTEKRRSERMLRAFEREQEKAFIRAVYRAAGGIVHD